MIFDSSIISAPAHLSLRANFSWVFTGNIIYLLSQWGILIVIAKLTSPDMVGQFSLGLAVTAPVIMFTNLQLRAVQATDYKADYRFTDYLSLRFIMLLFAMAIISGITLYSDFKPKITSVIFMVGAAKAIE